MHDSEAHFLLDGLPKPRILVFGDLVLDRYVWGNVERVSQEAPILLLRSQRTETCAGDAAAVCDSLRALQAEVCCAGLVGDDEEGQALRRMLRSINVDCTALASDAEWGTPVTERFVGRTAGRQWHQILQVEYEAPQTSIAKTDSALARHVSERIGDCQVALVYDSGRGACTPKRVSALMRAAADRQVPVFAAPSSAAELPHYRGANVLVVDRQLAESATGAGLHSDADILAAGSELCRQCQLEAILIMLEPHGLAVVRTSGETNIFSVLPRRTFDFTDVRPVMLATLGLAVARGANLSTAAELANVAASLVGERPGGSSVSRDEIRVELLRQRGRTAESKVVPASEVARIAEVARTSGQKVVFTNGCFDILHEGHAAYLEQAAAQGDVLIVGLNSDGSVRSVKGPTRPLRKENARASVLAALGCVDYVVSFNESTPQKLIEAVRPDVLVKGGDWRGREQEIAGRAFVESYGGRLYLAPVVEGVSTTQIVRSIAA